MTYWWGGAPAARRGIAMVALWAGAGTLAGAALASMGGCAVSTPAGSTPAGSTPAGSTEASADSSAQDAERAEAEARDPNRLPASLESLDLSPQQRIEILEVRAHLREPFADIEAAARGFLRAAAPSIRRCRGDSPSIGLAAERVIAVGNQARGPLLNSVDQLHALLTPAQRKALAARLLDDDDERDDDDKKSKREKRDNGATKSLGARMDLSIPQMIKLLIRVSAVRDDFEDQLKPWRAHYRDGLRAFARDDFSARKQKVARAPAAKVVVMSVRKALRVVVPMLDPEQCQEASTILLEFADSPPRRRR